jgi:hypothetical protein
MEGPTVRRSNFNQPFGVASQNLGFALIVGHLVLSAIVG